MRSTSKIPQPIRQCEHCLPLHPLDCYARVLIQVVNRMVKIILVLIVVGSVAAGVALDQAGWRHRKQLWQLQGGAVGLVAGFVLGRSKLV